VDIGVRREDGVTSSGDVSTLFHPHPNTPSTPPLPTPPFPTPAPQHPARPHPLEAINDKRLKEERRGGQCVYTDPLPRSPQLCAVAARKLDGRSYRKREEIAGGNSPFPRNSKNMWEQHVKESRIALMQQHSRRQRRLFVSNSTAIGNDPSSPTTATTSNSISRERLRGRELPISQAGWCFLPLIIPGIPFSLPPSHPPPP